MPHSFFPPSGASFWSKCNLWPTMSLKYPEPETQEAAEGSAAHWVGWEILAGRKPKEGDATPISGQVVTDEMLDGGDLLARTICALGQDARECLHVEQPIAIPFIHETCFGTPDCWVVERGANWKLNIIDYKFGHGFVDEFWNPQGLCYLSGIMDKLSNDWGIGPGILDQNLTVSFTVVQPRCFHKGKPVRTHTFNAAAARPYLNQLRAAAEFALMPEPNATTNENCGYCPGRHSCSTLQLAAGRDAEYATNRTPLELSPAAAGLELKMLTRALARLEARVDGLKQVTEANLKAGRSVPYYRLDPTLGRAKWTLPEEQLITIGKLFGADLSKPGVITPNQAEKAGVSKDVIKAYSIQPAGMKLVPDDPADARKVFE
jgi:Protein of unknown function (DUF2800)